MNEKTINFVANTFRHRSDEDGNESGEFITFSSYSKNLQLAIEELGDYIHFSKNKHHAIDIVMYDENELIFRISFFSDEEFFKFKKKVEDARLDDYKEWLLSNYQDGAVQSLPASNGKSAEITTEGN